MVLLLIFLVVSVVFIGDVFSLLPPFTKSPPFFFIGLGPLFPCWYFCLAAVASPYRGCFRGGIRCIVGGGSRFVGSDAMVAF